MKAGTLSQAVAQAAIAQAEEELRALQRASPAREEKQTARILRMLPRPPKRYAHASRRETWDCAIRDRLFKAEMCCSGYSTARCLYGPRYCNQAKGPI